MAKYPGCAWKPYVDATSEPAMKPTQFIIHSFGSTSDDNAVWSYFNSKNTNLESHFIMGLSKTVQGLDTLQSADANYKANKRPDGTGAISVETQGTGNEEWTPWQIAELIRLMREAHRIDKIPRRICRTHDDPGYGFHTLFGAPSPWTPVAKSCPGVIRIKQFYEEIWPKFLNSYKTKVIAMSDGIKPVLIRIGKRPEVYQIIAGAFRVHIPDSTSMTLMGWDANDVQSISTTHIFATIPIMEGH